VGNTLAFDASLQYRVWNSAPDANSPSFLFGVIEGNITILPAKATLALTGLKRSIQMARSFQFRQDYNM